jgi:arylsulfatase
MCERHELFKKAYPDQENAHGIPYTGLSNARPETLEIVKRLKREKAAMPKSVQKYMN